ncbi:rhomboid family membrane protein [Campylobacter blaseri]|uniref:Rhomboid family intramembrane serine protease n=1 Tax=Campylobacter blaseri TaxID=2042961 RepID=A0A2P8QYT4_9BACT|nr:rhomboid family intramembrane serine protease [Campylobacter blaseri]PSM51414.1 rhomboid family intramembrane serine protease [Campylobacter blaseri]PSM52864.1 rhomboid family intramembrane serine protease [Campylobacter blaseri]QKF86168.1 rhomboid family membrane protein [Campylobacter blaseri]
MNLQATTSLIVINFIVFLVGDFIMNHHMFFTYFGLNYLFFSGFYWQVFTTMFLHGSLMHLVMNMAVLYQFGSILERYLGGIKFTLIYLIGGILTSALSLVYTYLMINNGIVINLVGASGAISVLLGLLAYLNIYMRKGLFLAIILISFAPMLVGIKVGWYAHLIGFGLGYLYAKIGLRS